MKFIIAILILSAITTINAQTTDSLRVYWLDPVEVTAQREAMGQMNVDISRDVITRNLNNYGFSMIRKGVFFAQDVYADGFKKGDINVVIDGERYPNACPNRMDSPITRVNPLDVASADLSKTSASCYSGLGGMVQFHRSVPSEKWAGKASFSQTGASLTSTDISALLEGLGQKITVRYATGKPYESGDGSTFTDLYNYKSNEDAYQLGELSYQGEVKDFQYGAGVSITRDIQFPYLKMDERTNDLYNVFVGYKGHKIYANYTSHLMDNGLRTDGMTMVTDATNYIIGVSGEHYDAYYRNWDIDNFLEKPSMFHIDNHMIPDMSQAGANYNRKFKMDDFIFSGKLGLQHVSMGDEEQLKFNQVLYPDAESSRTFFNFGFGASYNRSFNKETSGGLMLEVASENPDLEFLYIGVRKPAGKVWWAGNPTLEAPMRTTGRLLFNYSGISLEAFATKVWRYVTLANAVADSQMYTTYGNIDAIMTGFNLRGEWTYFDLNANYTWAQNQTDNVSLAEIPPFILSARIKSPVFYGFKASLLLRYQAEQNRVDEDLGELPSESLYTLGLELDYNLDQLRISIGIENLTNENYYQHLSYLRDPFQSGNRVYDPGMVVRLNIIYMGF